MGGGEAGDPAAEVDGVVEGVEGGDERTLGADAAAEGEAGGQEI